MGARESSQNFQLAEEDLFCRRFDHFDLVISVSSLQQSPKMMKMMIFAHDRVLHDSTFFDKIAENVVDLESLFVSLKGEQMQSDGRACGRSASVHRCVGIPFAISRQTSSREISKQESKDFSVIFPNRCINS